MFEFPPDYKLHNRLPPWSPLEDLMEFLYQYHFLKIHGKGNTHYGHTKSSDEIYFEFMNEETIKLFEVLLILHMENALTIKLRLPKKSEGWIRNGFIELLEPYNKKVGFLKYALDTKELYLNFKEIKKKIHNQDTLFIDIFIHGYVFAMIFFKAVGAEKGVEFSGTPEESRLMEKIGNMINHNPDYQNEIILHYDIEDYITKNHLNYPIIYDLAENGFLEVKDIIFQNKELQIILHRFNNFPMQNTKEILKLNEDKKEDVDENLEFIFHDTSRELIYGKKNHKFRKDSLCFKAVKYAFSEEINEHLWYEVFYEEYDDRTKNCKQQIEEMSTMISKYNDIFLKKFGVKDFFGRGDGYYYRRY